MRFHILGLSHTKVLPEYSACAFTNKVRLLCKMLHSRGHTVYLYAPEGSEAECAEIVDVLSDVIFQKVHGPAVYDWRTEGFRLSRDNYAYKTFARNAIRQMVARAEPGDFILCPFGLDHQPIAEAVKSIEPGVIVVESGIGYDHTFAPYRIFESYAWMHITYGKEQKHHIPSFYDAVIPNGYDLEEYRWPRTLEPGAGQYFFFIARPNHDKGLSIAKDIATAVGIPLVTAGQGTPEQWTGTTHLGVLDAEQRNLCMANARAVLCPSLYVEPLCNVSLESALCGTPVITTDWGAFSENVLHGLTGYRCKNMSQFIWAAEHIDQIDRETCRQWVAQNFSLEHIGLMYEEFFVDLAGVHGGERGDWNNRWEGRTNFDCLTRSYPQGSSGISHPHTQPLPLPLCDSNQGDSDDSVLSTVLSRA